MVVSEDVCVTAGLCCVNASVSSTKPLGGTIVVSQVGSFNPSAFSKTGICIVFNAGKGREDSGNGNLQGSLPQERNKGK